MQKHFNSGNVIRTLMEQYLLGRAANVSPDIAAQMLKSHDLIATSTAEELARRCNVSVSTVHRFYKALGFSTYSEFRIKFTDSIIRYPYEQEIVRTGNPQAEEPIWRTAIQAAHESLDALEAGLLAEQLDALTELMHHAKTVYIHDPVYRPEYAFLGELLVLTGKNVVFSNTADAFHADVRTMDSDSLLLAVCSKRERWHNVNRELPEARATGAKICIITSSALPDLHLYDCVLRTEPTHNATQATIHGILLIIIASAYRRKYFIEE